MKKMLLFSVFGMLLFTSCKKDRTCVLKKSDGSVLTTKVYPNMTKSAALDACEGELKNAQNSVLSSTFKGVTAEIQ